METKRKRPSLTPLIDVVFLLLIFFMIVSRLSLEQMQELSLPTTGTANIPVSDKKIERVKITLQADGLISHQDQTLHLTEFQALMQNDLAQPIDVSLGEEVTLQQTLELIEALGIAGFTEVKLQMREQGK
ncbi:biopolymer transporter ExbD [Kordiimonas sp. SCSIO 12603]|uniref:ExbD/TolR family protein n=1 Tax=Kordiimonas sp. SCSIO 12603 TaxID=2829596 RepID=UPI002102E750|nr:biopolymer transporter ExbD [Kordiimonas sp. SCSIO 12603]UTW58791.1 biopolymer transporter ExbD [Kordiimonas sp. SCSIO 12603]